MATDSKVPLDHRLLVYSDLDEYVSCVLPFIEEGLAGGDRVVALSTPANLDALRRELGAGGDRVVFAEADGWYRRPSQMLHDLHRESENTAAQRLRVAGEAVWVNRGACEVANWIRHESAVNVALAPRAASIMCAYNANRAGPELLAAARHTHPSVHRAGDETDYVEPADFLRRLDAAPLAEPPADAAVVTPVSGLSEVRSFVAGLAREAGLDQERVEDVTVAVNEVITNAVVHGDGVTAVRAWREPDRLVFEVCDRGEGLADPLAGFIPPRPGQEGGRGLWLARQLLDQVEVRNRAEGAAVRLHASLAD